MAASLDDVKTRIKTRVPLDQLIGETVTLVRRGANVMACCPFHNEKSPSFHIYADGHYYCYGCKENGDAITFVRKTRELSFIEALRFLASKYGVEAPELEESDIAKRRRGEHSALTQMMAAAQEFFVAELSSPRGDEARQYLRERGFSDENILTFGFGLTPAEGFGLVRHLRSLGFREEDMVRASLAGISTKSGRPYDFFRERIMIPIRDPHGRVIAFGGRTTSGDPAKYKNSGSTPLFDKSAVLFGLDRARDAIKDHRRAVIVEGYMDALALWQAGLHEVVACMGTSLTVRQLKTLYQHTKTSDVILLFDGDAAGQEQTLNKVDVVLEVPELRVTAARLTDQDDPDTFVMKRGLPALEAILGQSVDLMDAAIGSRLTGINAAAIPTIVTSEFVPWLAKTTDAVKRGYLISKVSQLTGIGSDVIERQIRTAGWAASGPSSRQVQGATQVASHGPPEEPARLMLPTRPLSPIEVGILGHLFFARPGDIDYGKVSKFIGQDLNMEPLWENFARHVGSSYANGRSPHEHLSEILAAFSAEEIAALAAVTELAPEKFSSSDRGAAIDVLMAEHRRRNIQQSMAILKRQLQIAATQSPQDVPGYLQEMKSLSQELQTIDRGVSGR
jgi:DNA primase